jgi:hypothetical protein
MFSTCQVKVKESEVFDPNVPSALINAQKRTQEEKQDAEQKLIDFIQGIHQSRREKFEREWNYEKYMDEGNFDAAIAIAEEDKQQDWRFNAYLKKHGPSFPQKNENMIRIAKQNIEQFQSDLTHLTEDTNALQEKVDTLKDEKKTEENSKTPSASADQIQRMNKFIHDYEREVAKNKQQIAKITQSLRETKETLANWEAALAAAKREIKTDKETWDTMVKSWQKATEDYEEASKDKINMMAHHFQELKHQTDIVNSKKHVMEYKAKRLKQWIVRHKSFGIPWENLYVTIQEYDEFVQGGKYKEAIEYVSNQLSTGETTQQQSGHAKEVSETVKKMLQEKKFSAQLMAKDFVAPQSTIDSQNADLADTIRIQFEIQKELQNYQAFKKLSVLTLNLRHLKNLIFPISKLVGRRFNASKVDFVFFVKRKHLTKLLSIHL